LKQSVMQSIFVIAFVADNEHSRKTGTQTACTNYDTKREIKVTA